MNADSAAQVLRDYRAARAPEADPELEALRLAILLEDTFGITLSDAEIDPAVLADPSAAAGLVRRLMEAG